METILVAGANGKTGREIIALLEDHVDYSPVAMIRKEEQKAYFDNRGVNTVVADLEGDLRQAVKGVDRIIFAAGSGGATPPEKTTDVDQNGAINLIDQAKAAGVKKFIMLSSMGADQPAEGPMKLQHYLEAKKAADDHLRASFLEYSIIRPGMLTEKENTNKIEAAPKLGKHGEISRKDVAQVLVDCLPPNMMQNKTAEIIDGNMAIELALEELGQN